MNINAINFFAYLPNINRPCMIQDFINTLSTSRATIQLKVHKSIFRIPNQKRQLALLREANYCKKTAFQDKKTANYFLFKYLICGASQSNNN